MAENQQERVLHLHVTLELKDYFRYYLDTIKVKILIAAIIYAVVTTGFIYFFTLIGEQETLLKTSPLFLGFPAVAIVGQLLRVHASYRKYLTSLSDSEKNAHLIFREPGSGYDVVWGDNFSHVAWGSVRSVVEKTRYFQFCFNKYDSYIIPKRFFHSESEQELLREILRSHLGSRAKLFESNEVQL
jgi:hypothetical protein